MFLGKKLAGISKTELGVIDLQLNRIGMGYMELKKTQAHAPIKWIESENSYVHQFSLYKRMYDYGFYRTKEVMDINEYLHTPADLIDTIMEGLKAGSEARLKSDSDKTPSTTDSAEALVEKILKGK